MRRSRSGATEGARASDSMTPGFCKHCIEFKDLCNSHAIPNAVFRPLLRTTHRGAVNLVDDVATSNGYSTDS